MSTELTPLSNAEIIRSAFKEGMPWVLRDYFERLRDRDTTSTEDIRKAVELGSKVLIDEKNKTDGLVTVNWVINGGSVTMEITPPAVTVDADITDVTEVTKTTGSPSEPLPAPTPAVTKPAASTTTFDMVSNLLDEI